MATINNRAGSIALEFCCAMKSHKKDVMVDGWAQARKTPDLGLHILSPHLSAFIDLDIHWDVSSTCFLDMILSVKQMRN